MPVEHGSAGNASFCQVFDLCRRLSGNPIVQVSTNPADATACPLVKVVDGKVKILDEPGRGMKINPAWIAKAFYLESERAAKA
jgi:hypothetical protein